MMVRNVLSIKLPAVEEGFSLSCLNNRNRMNETEFFFPLNPISPETFKQVFRQWKNGHDVMDFPERFEKLTFSPAKGFMKGYIDMIFQARNRYFIVDWKSNYLGSTVTDYTKNSLNESMAMEFYFLQYFLYSLALHQYLKINVPKYRYERHFGGVFYIFLRGINPDLGPDWGIFYDLPDQYLIKTLGTALIPGFKT
jgi:exodeoxyribonuclease V beta subunit